MPPKPLYPVEGEPVYFRKQDKFLPTLRWMEPKSWGWTPAGISHEYVVEVDGKTENVKSEENTTEYKWKKGLDDKEHNWRVGAKPVGGSIVWSDVQTFKVCCVNGIGAPTLVAPERGGIVGSKNVELQWGEAEWNKAECAKVEDYGYTYRVVDGAGRAVVSNTTQKTVGVVAGLGEGEYRWSVEAYGPGGVKAASEEWRFSVCLEAAPGAPSGVVAVGGPKVVCMAGAGDASVDVVWAAPSSSGKVCGDRGVGGRSGVVYNMSVDGAAAGSSDTEAGRVSVKCETGDVRVGVSAWNGALGSATEETVVNVCAKSLPDTPVVDNQAVGSQCRRKTKVAWRHSGNWGSPCLEDGNGAVEAAFVLRFVKGSDVFTVTVNATESRQKQQQQQQEEEHAYEVELEGGGEWTFSVEATAGTGATSPASAGVTVVAASFRAATGLNNTNYVDAEAIEFSWDIDQNVAECAGEEGVTGTLHYTVTGDEKSETAIPLGNMETVRRHNISWVRGQIQWSVELMNSAGDTATSGVVVYSAANDCQAVKPRWAEGKDVLTQPAAGAVVFGAGQFRWAEVEGFGVACLDSSSSSSSSSGSEEGGRKTGVVDKEAARYYGVVVNGTEYNASLETAYSTAKLTKGEAEWKVRAHHGTMTVESETRRVCLADDVPSVELKCNNGGLQVGLVLEWNEADCK